MRQDTLRPLTNNLLYTLNYPARLWKVIERAADEEIWEDAFRASLFGASMPECVGTEIPQYLEAVLGEGRFGPLHWRLSPAKRLYYSFKPIMPRFAARSLRQLYRVQQETSHGLNWPIEARYVCLQWELMRQYLIVTGQNRLPFVGFWPTYRRFALVLTHDIETADGQQFVPAVADLEESYGFRSSFNFVAERYRLDRGLIRELRDRGFEIGVHGLKHDGKLFTSRAEFLRRAKIINCYLKELSAVGFRSPLTHRQPEWMQALEIEYDSSFFDTDPYEPIPGGTMSIWPFFIGHFVELPYTLVQDYTLTVILSERTPRIWLEKVDFIERYHGMALINTHPDYLRKPMTWNVYEEFLKAMQARQGYWHALPREVARWWRARAQAHSVGDLRNAVTACARLEGSNLFID